MKKNGKFLAALLCAAMTVSSAWPVYADAQSGGDAAVQTAAVQVQPESETQQAGSDDASGEEAAQTAGADKAAQANASTDDAGQTGADAGTDGAGQTGADAGTDGAGQTDADASAAALNTLTAETAQSESETQQADGSAEAIIPDSSTSLPDGEYTDVTVTAQGGTKRAKFSCSKVTVSGGKATAHLTISSKTYTDFFLGTTSGSDAAAIDQYIQENASGADYKTAVSGKTASADIPVSLGKPMALAGRTTGMSNPHRVNYTLTISVNAAPAADTCTVSFPLQDASGNVISGTVTVSDENGNAVSPAGGAYTLTKGKTYTIKASAESYTARTLSYTASGSASYPVRLTREQASSQVQICV